MALHHVTSGEVVDLSPLGSELNSAQTRALVKTDSFEAIYLAVPAGGEMPPHKVSGRFTLHCLEGRVEVGLEDKVVELPAHGWVYFDGGVLHSVRGLEHSSLLLTIMLPASGSSAQTA
ncbi:cupin [Sphingopyxis sp. SE2]|uniref:cupin n=1 Tax=Sphingopyxis sp. SE2 TaxID=1586240 RepID=UPI0028BF8A0F|nr:cupin [Sphingopyxis sp. SE2]MDT7527767.1 cupin [Sphingopyxis sp. SE2]